MIDQKALQNEIIAALTPHLKSEHIEPLEYDGAVWVQVDSQWAKIEPQSPGLRAPEYARSFRITTGHEAGFDLAGGEKIEPKVSHVGGLKFGMVPHVLRWVDYHGKARP